MHKYCILRCGDIQTVSVKDPLFLLVSGAQFRMTVYKASTNPNARINIGKISSLCTLNKRSRYSLFQLTYYSK